MFTIENLKNHFVAQVSTVLIAPVFGSRNLSHVVVVAKKRKTKKIESRSIRPYMSWI
jgi:hypothetical protein